MWEIIRGPFSLDQKTLQTMSNSSSSSSSSCSDVGNGRAIPIGPTPNHSNSTTSTPQNSTTTTTTTTTTITKPRPTFHRRPLPSHLIQLSSEHGKQLFREALSAGFMEAFFLLAEHFHTQMDPSYCGLGTLTMVLNALLIDPDRLWRGSWRWFSEEMLDCCVPLEVVQTKGITMDQFRCLAQCNGANVLLFRAAASDASSATAEAEADSVPTQSKSTIIQQSNSPMIVDHPQQQQQEEEDHVGKESMMPPESVKEGSEEQFRRSVCESCGTSGDRIVVVSYDRKTLSQTGSGHFSPIGGYHPATDMVLIFDVARFKYPPHWCPLSLLWKAMLPLDLATGLSRGFMIVSRASKNNNNSNNRCSLFCKMSLSRTANWDDIGLCIHIILPRILNRNPPPTDLSQLVTLIVRDVFFSDSLDSIFQDGEFSQQQRHRVLQMRAAICGSLTMFSQSLEIPSPTPQSTASTSTESKHAKCGKIEELRKLRLFHNVIKPTMDTLANTTTSQSLSDVGRRGTTGMQEFLHSAASSELVTIIMLSLPLDFLRSTNTNNTMENDQVQLSSTQVIEELENHQKQITQFSEELRDEIEQLHARMTAISGISCCFFDHQSHPQQQQQNPSCSCCLHV